jgi:predicted transcriptional regulator
MRKRASELRVRIDEGIMDTLKEIAAKEGRTVSELVREALADLIQKRQREKGNVGNSGNATDSGQPAPVFGERDGSEF